MQRCQLEGDDSGRDQNAHDGRAAKLFPYVRACEAQMRLVCTVYL